MTTLSTAFHLGFYEESVKCEESVGKEGGGRCVSFLMLPESYDPGKKINM